MFDNYTIILLALAIIIILLKLRSVLGPRTGRGRPPGISRSTDNYEESLAIMRKLAAADPGNTSWRSEMSVSCERVGRRRAFA